MSFLDLAVVVLALWVGREEEGLSGRYMSMRMTTT
jgi:hypothetical protein